MKNLVFLVVILLVILGGVNALSRLNFNIPEFLKKPPQINISQEKVKVLNEESAVIDIVKRDGPSVVTVSQELPASSSSPFEFGPFFFDAPDEDVPTEPQDIGSGFVVPGEGLIVTNKHVVSEPGAKYHIVTVDEKKYDVQNIYRDPLNDIAILKIDPNQNRGVTLKPLDLGDSSKLQVGQFVVAIGTALGEFRNTVTTGVISGLGRGITAGSQFQGFVEALDNVIQTDAAINPGNSGGPLINSSGQVIGVNTAIATRGENVGFALPINVIKDSLKNFNETGQFNRPYLGISYSMITRDLSIRSELPEGAYVRQVIESSAADKAGVQRGDIITKIDGQKLTAEKNELASVISKKKIGDTINLTIFREDQSDAGGKTLDLKATLESAPNQ